MCWVKRITMNITIMAEYNELLKATLNNRTKQKEKDRITKINKFKDTLSFKNNNNKEDKSNIYNSALQCAMSTLFDCISLSFEEILEEFSTTDNVLLKDQNTDKFYPGYKHRYRIQRLNHENNTIILPLDVEIPKRYDKKIEKLVPIDFRVSWMYRNDKFLEKCNNYYSKFGLQITFENLTKNKWKIELKILNDYILRPDESSI